MSTWERIAITVLVAVAVGVSVADVSLAQNQSQDLNDITCKDIMRTSGTERDLALAFMHGYLLGKKGTSQYHSDKLGEATDAFIEYCLDNPKAKAVDALSKFVK